MLRNPQTWTGLALVSEYISALQLSLLDAI